MIGKHVTWPQARNLLVTGLAKEVMYKGGISDVFFMDQGEFCKTTTTSNRCRVLRNRQPMSQGNMFTVTA